MNDAIEMRADRRALVDVAALVAVHGNLSTTAADYRPITRLDGSDVVEVTPGEVVLELFGDVQVFSQVLRRRLESHTRRIVESSPLVLASLDQLVEYDAGDGAVGHSVTRVAGGNPDMLIGAGILPDVRHVVYRLDDLTRPPILDALQHREALASPLLEPDESLFGVTGLTGFMILTADDQHLVIQ